METKGGRLANNFNTILVTVLSSITAACAVAVVLFLMDLKEKVPSLIKGQNVIEKKVDDMQGSINGLSTRFTTLSGEQIKQGVEIDNLKEKYDYSH